MSNFPIDVPLPDSVKKYLAQPHCADIALPKPGKAEVCLPLGGRLQGMVDATKGIPDDCSLTFSLLLQLGPIMASIECLIKVLKLEGQIFDAIANLDFADLGFIVVGAFVVTWIAAFAIFKLRRVEERWGAMVENDEMASQM